MGLRGFLSISGMATCCAALGSGFSNVYAFGDSLSDVGNVYAATGGAIPAAPYWNGRFSNGPVWEETLSAHYGIAMTPSFTGGNGYAWGGAESGTGNSPDLTPNVGKQISTFQSAGHHFLSTDLVTLWAGGNDFINGQLDPSVPVANLKMDLNALHGLGARSVLVPNLPLLGYFPDVIGTSLQNAANQLSIQFDADLHAMIQQVRASDSGLTIYELDVKGFFDAVRANPKAYGFNDVTHAYLGSGSAADPNTFLFFDSDHPTAHAHQLLGEAAISSVPEPAELLGMGFGLGFLSLLRRRLRPAPQN